MLTIKRALLELIGKGATKYQIAKDLRVQPIQIDNWIKEKTKSMRRPAAERMKLLYGTEIPELFINDRKDDEDN